MNPRKKRSEHKLFTRFEHLLMFLFCKMARIEFTKGRLILLNWSEHDADRNKEEKKWKRKEKNKKRDSLFYI